MRRGKYENFKQPIVNTAMCLAVVLFWLVIITTYMSSGLYARYSTQASGKDSARVITFGNLTLAENGVDNATGENFYILPGVDIQKEVTVSFTGSEAAVFVFVKANTPGWDRNGNIFYKGTGLLEWTVDTANWTYLTSNGNDHVYYTFLKPGETLDKVDFILNDTVKVGTKDRTSYNSITGDLQINVTAYAVQANGFITSDNMAVNAANAWAALNP